MCRFRFYKISSKILYSLAMYLQDIGQGAQLTEFFYSRSLQDLIKESVATVEPDLANVHEAEDVMDKQATDNEDGDGDER